MVLGKLIRKFRLSHTKRSMDFFIMERIITISMNKMSEVDDGLRPVLNL